MEGPKNTSVEDASSSDNEDLDFEDNDLPEHGFYFLDDESTSEEYLSSDEDEKLDEDELNKLMNEAKIKHFTDILTDLIYHPSAMQTMWHVSSMPMA